jgi:hypothetical protein
VTTPVNWKKGDDVIVHPAVKNDEAKQLFPQVTFHKVRASLRAESTVNTCISATLLEDNALDGVNIVICLRGNL